MTTDESGKDMGIGAQRREVARRLRSADLVDGGSHENLDAICRAVYEPAYGWTRGACDSLRWRLAWLLDGGDVAWPADMAGEGAGSHEPVTAMLRRSVLPMPDGLGGELTIEADDFHDCCDAIDSLHARLERENVRMAGAIDELEDRAASEFAKGFATALEDEDVLAEQGWVRLPVDADGRTWRIGDLTERRQRVLVMVLGEHGWHFQGCPGAIDPKEHRHAVPDTPATLMEDFRELERKAKGHEYGSSQAFYDAMHGLIARSIRMALKDADGGDAS